MTTTDDLIERLAAEVKPIRRGASRRRLAAGIGVGAVISLALLVAWLGTPLPVGAAAFARKALFPAALFVIASFLLIRSGQPGREVGRRWLWLLLPPLVLASSALLELSAAPATELQSIWLGSTWLRCVSTIVGLSLPILAGLVWAFRRYAPTRLDTAGLMAGFTAGSAAAILYALYCREGTATFLLSWYSLGILCAGLVGLLAGPKLLRW